MYTCIMSIYLAYGMAIYCLACIWYLVFTRGIGTPFNDSLSEKQIKIKNESATKRRYIFYAGIIVSCIFLYGLKPFHKCH